jgi:hypothetical protein
MLRLQGRDRHLSTEECLAGVLQRNQGVVVGNARHGVFYAAQLCRAKRKIWQSWVN